MNIIFQSALDNHPIMLTVTDDGEGIGRFYKKTTPNPTKGRKKLFAGLGYGEPREVVELHLSVPH